MTTSPVWTVWCDSGLPGLPMEIRPNRTALSHPDSCLSWTGQEESRAEAQALAKAEGWTLTERGRRAVCPPCARRQAKA